ncbi:MAG TPA: low affinity iron permease family protein [Acidimicrobiales bacterium]|nr:low affinity iron permease family protein [Acidimicrobiales bacterium]
MERSTSQLLISRFLHWVGDMTARAGAAALVAAIVIGLNIVLITTNYSARWEALFATVSASITLVMLFVIQHTQNRQQAVIQLKLDELIRSSPEADNILVHLEAADDIELIELEQDQIALHSAIREPAVEDEFQE